MTTIKGVNLFRDEAGQVAQLHGIGVQRFGERWFAYGEVKTEGNLFQGVACYVTADFVHWRSAGVALPVGEPGDFLGPTRIVERPKVLRCPSTGKYVMFLHVDGENDYNYAHLGFAVADAPTGPFELRCVQQWRGCISRDIGVFQDEDGVGYVLSEDRSNGTHLYRLSDDYLTIAEDVVCLRGADGGFGYESPILLKRNGMYYWFGSQLTGWACNDNMYAVASDLRGPWSSWRPFAPEGSRTFESQCDVIVPLGGVDQWHAERFLYIGDRWNPDDLGNSELVTLPIEIGDGQARLTWHDEWEIEP